LHVLPADGSHCTHPSVSLQLPVHVVCVVNVPPTQVWNELPRQRDALPVHVSPALPSVPLGLWT